MATLMGIPAPTVWGQGLLAIALVLSSLQAVGWQRRWVPLASLTCVFLAFVVLITAHLTDDFCLLNVFAHSHQAKPWLYKLGGAWGNHEGSMLLWVLILAGYNSALIRRTTPPAARMTMGILMAGFLGFLLLASDPFTYLIEAPTQGQDLNPLLQDISLMIHPPFLYAGLVGLSVPFALGVAILIEGQWSPPLLKQLHIGALVAWCFLTLGLGLGSFWAYYELGWGGWWFWDPVENVALMPWLVATALIHSLRAVACASALRLWTLFLCLLGFSLSLIGSFLVRSGLLVSVHSFAVDPTRGWLLLSLTILIMGAAGGIWCYRWSLFVRQSTVSTTPLSRTGMILLNNTFILFALFVLSIGTFYPIVRSFSDHPLSIGAPYFQTLLVPLMVPLLIMMACVPWLMWTRCAWADIWPSLLPAFIVTGSSYGLLYLYAQPRLLPLLIAALALGMVIASLQGLVQGLRLGRAWYQQGMLVAHIGFAILLLGMVGATEGEQEKLVTVSVGESLPIAGYTLVLASVNHTEGPNYTAERADLQLYQGKRFLKSLTPERRFYWTQGVHHNETAIYSLGLSHVYVMLGEPYGKGRWSIHIYYKPWVNLLWGGVVIMLLGGGGVTLVARSRTLSLLCLLLLYLSVPANAVNAHEQLTDTHLEAVARQISQGLYCPVCSGQTIDDSQAPFAETLRRYIRQRLREGADQDTIQHDMVARFGESILLTPRDHWLWIMPWLLMGLVIMGISGRWWQRSFKGFNG
jgi:cytochrome c-type biogenesis protein CcmF